MIEIRQITPENFHIDSHAALLIDAVDSGASIGFIAPLSQEQAIAYWQGVHQALINGHTLLGAFSQGQLVGSVQLSCSHKANGLHRAEVEKLFVSRSHRGQGVAAFLMQAIEEKAREMGRWLLFLDTKQGDTAERLYMRIGYARVGVIPNFAANSGGGYAGTVFFYKQLTAR